jgi:hypothetical protein
MQLKLKISYVPTASLVPYVGNAKEHPDWQVEQIARSIDQLGFNDPVGIWHDEDGTPIITEGHGRVLAAKKLGMETIPIVTLDHLDDDGRRAYTLIHNKLTTNTDYDLDTLADELANIDTIDMSEFGFDGIDDIEFEDFDGLGDGGGSRMGSGSGCRVVIGPHIVDIKEDGDECYKVAKALDPDRIIEFMHDALLNGDIGGNDEDES